MAILLLLSELDLADALVDRATEQIRASERAEDNVVRIFGASLDTQVPRVLLARIWALGSRTLEDLDFAHLRLELLPISRCGLDCLVLVSGLEGFIIVIVRFLFSRLFGLPIGSLSQITKRDWLIKQIHSGAAPERICR